MMTEQQMLEKIKQTRVVPVVVLNTIEETLPKMQALVNGGLPCAEITFRTCPLIQDGLRRRSNCAYG